MGNDKRGVVVRSPGRGMLRWRAVELERVQREQKTGNY